MAEFSIVMVTHINPEEGADLAKQLIRQDLCACVNIIPGVRSIYRWDGEDKDESEVLLFIKTKKDKVKSVISYVEKNHHYETPECIVLSIDDGSSAYLEWLASI